MEIEVGFLPALGPFRANLVELLVVPAVALEAADVVEAALVVDACRQRLDAQAKGHNAFITQGTLLALFSPPGGFVRLIFVLLRTAVNEREGIVPTGVPGHC